MDKVVHKQMQMQKLNALNIFFQMSDQICNCFYVFFYNYKSEKLYCFSYQYSGIFMNVEMAWEKTG